MNRSGPIRDSVLFFALTLGITDLLLWGPIVLFDVPTIGFTTDSRGPSWAIAMFVLGGFIPSLVAIFLTRIREGRGALKDLLKRVVKVRIGFRWYLAGIGVVLVGVLVQIGIALASGSGFDFSQFWIQLPTAVPLIVLGPLSEELGWRGYAQDKLQSRLNPMVSGLIVGVFWGLWHLPLFFMTGTTQHELSLPFLGFLVGTTAMSVVYGWLYAGTKRSIWSAVFLHWISTYALQVVASSIERTPTFNWLENVPFVVIAGSLWIVLSRRKSTAA